VPLIFFRCNFYKYIRIFVIFRVHNVARKYEKNTWYEISLPNVRFVATVPCKSLRRNTFRAILTLCTCLYRSNQWKPVSIKRTKYQAESHKFKIMFKIATIYMNIAKTTTVCPPDSVPDQQQRRCCRREVQFAVCHFLTFRQSFLR